ncbi:MAG: DUF4234 domain-containing protein [Lachnospiraceae bacterium]|nr:DUF4234 domain-containing protein [Lachnospiraceae bacterium]
MTCKHCGAQIEDNSSFCPTCGADLRENAGQQSTSNQYDYSSNQQYNQGGYNQNQQYNQGGYNQGQQFNQGNYNQGQQYNQGGFNQGQPYNPGQPYYRCPIHERNIVQCILLTVVTCGIYGLIWLVSLADDLNMISEEPNPTSGGLVLVLSIVTCNIYLIYWMYKAGERMNNAKQRRGLPVDSNSGLLYLVLTFFGLGIVSYCLIQSDLNKMATM